jgi:hypothetical protein
MIYFEEFYRKIDRTLLSNGVTASSRRSIIKTILGFGSLIFDDEKSSWRLRVA